ncbi:hypothetical protein [Haliangium sp.]|uniref:hypothetical protein n=1 Tax=Haliangium sp. TaxID=2663208 RepID=UPI003D0DD2B3
MQFESNDELEHFVDLAMDTMFGKDINSRKLVITKLPAIMHGQHPVGSPPMGLLPKEHVRAIVTACHNHDCLQELLDAIVEVEGDENKHTSALKKLLSKQTLRG